MLHRTRPNSECKEKYEKLEKWLKRSRRRFRTPPMSAMQIQDNPGKKPPQTQMVEARQEIEKALRHV